MEKAKIFSRKQRDIPVKGKIFSLSEKLLCGSILISALPSVSFSPQSGGRVKPSRAIEDISTQGTIKLKK